MIERYGIDTNVLIYYLTGKPEKKHQECLSLITKAEKGKIKIEVVPVVFWEATWILEKFYKNSKQQIVRILKMFLRLDGIKCKEKNTLIKSLNLWKQNNIDFADAYIISIYKKNSINDIYSYDKHMKNEDINCIKPDITKKKKTIKKVKD